MAACLRPVCSALRHQLLQSTRPGAAALQPWASRLETAVQTCSRGLASSRAPRRDSMAQQQQAQATGAGASAGMPKRIIRGVVFDMDGTVTVPCIDFKEMRRRAGVGTTGDILDVISSWPEPERRARAYAAIAEIEDEALANMKLMPGAASLCAFLDGANVPRGLITRNVMRSVRHFHAHHVTAQGLAPFEPSISRECKFAYKPSPEALLHICSTWGVDPREVVMVGDSVKDDIVCGNRAGSITVLLDYQGANGHSNATLEGELQPTHIVHGLEELEQLLADQYQLLAPASPHAAVVAMDGKTE